MKYLPDDIKADLARQFGTTFESLAFLGGGEDWSDGTVFEYPCAQSPTGLRVLKILSQADSEEDDWHRATERLEAVRWLGEQGCRIVTPQRLDDGSVFRQVRQDSWRFLAYSYDKAPGRHIQDEPCSRSGGFYVACGDLLGQLHAAWASRQETSGPDGSSPAYPHLGFWQQEMAMFREWCQEDTVREAWDHLRTALGKLPTTPDRYGFVHNDAHVWNMLFDPQAVPPGPDGTPLAGEPVLTLLDFDVAGQHWFLSDCANCLYSFVLMVAQPGVEKLPKDLPGFKDWSFAKFWEGYRRWRPVTAEWLQDLELFLQYRRCLMFMPFQNETAKNPGWRKSWMATISRADRELFGP